MRSSLVRSADLGLGLVWLLFGAYLLSRGILKALDSGDEYHHNANLVVAVFGGLATVAGLSRLRHWRTATAGLNIIAGIFLIYLLNFLGDFKPSTPKQEAMIWAGLLVSVVTLVLNTLLGRQPKPRRFPDTSARARES